MDDTSIPSLDFVGTPAEPETAAVPPLNFVDTDKVQLPDNVAQTRAVKADFALQDKSPGVEALQSGIAAGQENNMRADSALQIDHENYNKGLATVKQVAGKLDKPMSPMDIDTVMAVTKASKNATDPKTVWEKLYAANYLHAFTTDDQEHNFVYGKAMEQSAPEATDTLTRASNTQAWREVVATKMQDLQAQWDQSSWLTTIGRSAQALVPILENYFLHDAVKEAPKGSFLPGRNMLEQVQYAMMLPIDKRTSVVNATADQLFKRDPFGAFKFLKAMNDYSSSDVYLHDILGVVDAVAPFLPIGGTTVKGAGVVADAAAGAAGAGVAGRAMTRGELAVARQGTGDIVRADQAARTATTNRPMSVRELMAARDGLGIEPQTGFMTPAQISRAGEAVPKQGDVVSYDAGGQRFRPTNGTVYVHPDVLEQSLQASGENPRRIFRNADNQLEITERQNAPEGVGVGTMVQRPNAPYANPRRVTALRDGNAIVAGDARPVPLNELQPVNQGGRWVPTGQTIAHSTEPEVGRVPFNLGPESRSMGSSYYDNYFAGSRVTNVTRASVVEQPRQMSINEIAGARAGLPGRLMDANAIQLLRNSTAQAIKAYDPIKPLDLQGITTAMGNVPNAAGMGATRILTNKFIKGIDPLGEGEEFAKNIPSIMQGDAFFQTPSRSLSQELSEKYAASAIATNERLLGAVMNPTRAPRLDTPALQQAIETAKDKWKNDAYFKSDGMLDIEHIPANNVTNVDYISFNFAKQTKDLFDTPEQAAYWAKNEYKFHDGDWLVRQKGNKFMISVPRPLDETDPSVFTKMIATKNTETPAGLANMLFGYLRNAEDVLSKFNRDQRHIITHSPQELKAVLIDSAKDIGSLPKAQIRELEEILVQNQKIMKDGIPGQYFRDTAELEEAFLNRFNKLPTPNQVKAYDTYVRLNDFDGMLRVLGWHRDMSRQGVVNYRWALANVDGRVTKTDFIPGRPGRIDYSAPFDEGIYYHNTETGVGQFLRKFDLKDTDKATRREMDDKIKNGGYEIHQIFAPNSKPLASTTGVNDVINYVVTNAFEHKRLQWGEGVDWRPGGHMVYQPTWYVKSPLIRTGSRGLETYFGDATIRAGGNSEAEASALATKYDTARQLLKAGDDTALDAYLRGNLPESLTDFKKMFSGAGPGGGLSTDHPIVATYTGRNTFETNSVLAKEERYRGLREQATHPSNLEAALDKKFLAERGPILQRVEQAGTEANPYFKLEDAKLVDPYTTLNMALGNAVRSRFFTDYKQSVAAHWVSEFSDVIKGGMTNRDKLERNPVFALYHAELDPAIVSRERLQAAKAVRDRALMLLGQRSELGASINRIEQTTMNALYRTGGEKVTDAVTPAMLSAIRDPASYMRAVAFHSKLGFFNPVQILVQSQTMVHALAASPTNAIPAMAAWFASTRLRFTEADNIVNFLSKKIPGWEAGEFKEAYQTMKNAGISHVGGETSWRDDMFDPQIFTSGVSRFLDKGTVFFKEGERAAREVAWFTAFKEFKKANPGVEIGQREVGQILTRWQTLTGDMTRASNAGWQKGVFTIPSQFLTFNIRMMEQLLPGLSSRLTPAEKMRIIGVYSGLYGIPIGLSTMTGFYPAYDDMRKYAIDHQIDVHDNWFKLAHEGLLSTLASWATGRDYNIAQRLGPGANNLLVEVLKGNKDVVPLLAGPAGGVLADIAKTTVPFIRSAYYAAKGDDNQQYPITMEDFSGILQSDNIATLSNASKMLIGLNIGKYVAKNNVYVGDVTTMDSIMVGLGFTPMKIQDAQLTVQLLKDEKTMKDSIQHEVVKEIQMGIKLSATGDSDTAAKHFLRARTLEISAGFTITDHNKAFNTSLTGYESQADRANRRLLTTGSSDRVTDIVNKGQP